MYFLLQRLNTPYIWAFMDNSTSYSVIGQGDALEKQDAVTDGTSRNLGGTRHRHRQNKAPALMPRRLCPLCFFLRMPYYIRMECIILMGIKHCGKSTQARLLSGKLGLPCYDTDDVITAMTGKSPRTIYTEGGQEAFKAAEAEACRKLADRLTAEGEKAVIATGGGICCNEAALAALRPLGKFIFLNAPENAAADRIIREARELDEGGFENLPSYIARRSPHSILEIRSIFHDFYVERTALYTHIADIKLDMGKDGKEENTNKIAMLVSARQGQD